MAMTNDDDVTALTFILTAAHEQLGVVTVMCGRGRVRFSR